MVPKSIPVTITKIENLHTGRHT